MGPLLQGRLLTNYQLEAVKSVVLAVCGLALPLFCSSYLAAQDVELKFFTLADGLSSNRVWSVVQTKNGLLWMEADGLNRYDGYQFLNHLNRPEALFDPFSEGVFRIQAWGDSIILFQKDKLLGYNTLEGESFDLDFRRSLSPEESLGNYLGTIVYGEVLAIPIYEQDRWVAIMAYDNEQWQRYPLENSPLFTNGSKPILSDHGSFYFHQPANREIVEIDLEGSVINSFLAPESVGIGELASTSTGDLFLYTTNSCYQWMMPKQEWQEISIASIKEHDLQRLLVDHEGDLWITTTFDRQLLRYELDENRLTDFSDQIRQVIPHQQQFANMSIDRSGTLWLGSTTGLLRVHPEGDIFNTFGTQSERYCGGACSYRGFAEDEEGRVYASFYNNIIRADSIEGEAIDAFVSTTVNPTPFDLGWRKDVLLLPSGKVVSPASGQVSNPFGAQPDPNRPNGILETNGKGHYWWINGSRLFQLGSIGNNQWRWKQLLNEDVRIGSNLLDLCNDDERNGLWISKDNGLFFYDGSTKSLRDERIGTSADQDKIRQIELDEDGTLWLATESGLVHYDPATFSYNRYLTEDGLASNLVTGILPEGDSCLWVSTFRGLSRFDKRVGTFLSFFEEDGLPSNEFNYRSHFLASDGQMYFGGMGGFTRFRPAEVQKKIEKLGQEGRLNLTEIRVADGRRDSVFSQVFLQQDTRLELAHHHRQLDLCYALSKLSMGKPVKYSYRMLGLSDIWSPLSAEQQTTYNRLPPGNYRFQLRAMDQRGQWQQDQVDLPIRVLAPWYTTWWAYLLYALLLTALASAVLLFQRNRWRLRNALERKQHEAEQLKQLDGFKNRLFTNLTHEFRTPLTVMLGMSEELKDKSPDDLHQASQLIQRNGHELLRLVDQMLDLAKLDNGVYELDIRQSDIVAYVHYLAESFHSYANSRNQSLRFFSEQEALFMDFDANALAKILTNLIGNALKYSHAEGDIRVRVLVREERLVVSVSDTGIGITAEELPYVFDRFFQSRSGGQGDVGGVGIGLAFCKELSERMGATLAVESQLGQGSTFRLTLPITKEAPIDDGEKIIPAVDGQVSQTFEESLEISNKGLNAELPLLLIVEDNVDVVTYLRSCVAPFYRVAVAYNGRIGWERALDLTPDLIVSDVMMPEKDGFSLCDELKQDERTSHIPVVLLTAKADAASRIAGLKRGADAYLAKPFHKEELLVRLKQLLVRQERMRLYFSTQTAGETLEEKHPLLFKETESSDLQVTLGFEHSFLQRVQTVIGEHYSEEEFGLPQLCQQLSMSRSQLFRKLKTLLGLSPSEMIRRYRLEKARLLLAEGEKNVSEVAWAVGFKHVSHFSKLFLEAYGYSPSDTGK